MKPILKILVVFLFYKSSFAQQIDTLRVIVLSPHKVQISDNYLAEFNEINNSLLEKRSAFKQQKLNEKEAGIEEYNQLPQYSKIMFNNELNFYNSLTVNNYVSMAARQYIAHRLYKPFKIKPRIVVVTTETSVSNKKNYAEIAHNQPNTFIVNITEMKFSKESGDLAVQTHIELYSADQNKVIFSEKNNGTTEGGHTDYPMCEDGNWDCAVVNSVYKGLVNIVKIISEKNNDRK